MRTCTQAMNSAVSRRYSTARPPRATTSHRAACTSCLVVTVTRAAPKVTRPTSRKATSTPVGERKPWDSAATVVSVGCAAVPVATARVTGCLPRGRSARWAARSARGSFLRGPSARGSIRRGPSVLPSDWLAPLTRGSARQGQSLPASVQLGPSVRGQVWLVRRSVGQVAGTSLWTTGCSAHRPWLGFGGGPGRVCRLGLGRRQFLGGLAGGGDLLRFLRAGVEGGRGRDGPHPLAEPVPLVGEVADVGLGVLELRGPEQGVERTHLDADTAVHAEGEVDGEAVEDVAAAFAATGGRGGDRLLVGVDVDAPVGALTGAQHADRAVLLEQADHSAGAGREIGLGVGVLLGDGLLRHRAQGDGQALGEAAAGNRGHSYWITTLTMPVRAIWARERGTRRVQESFWSWSSRRRG